MRAPLANLLGIAFIGICQFCHASDATSNETLSHGEIYADLPKVLDNTYYGLKAQPIASVAEAIEKSKNGLSPAANDFFRKHKAESIGPLLKAYFEEQEYLVENAIVALGPDLVKPVVTELRHGAYNTTITIQNLNAAAAASGSGVPIESPSPYPATSYEVRVPYINASNSIRLQVLCDSLLQAINATYGARDVKPELSIHHRDQVNAVAVHPTTNIMATCCRDMLFLWDLTSGKQIDAFALQAPPNVFTVLFSQFTLKTASEVHFSGDAKQIVAAMDDEIVVFDWKKKSKVRRIHVPGLKSIYYCAMQNRVVTLDSQGHVAGWDIATGNSTLEWTSQESAAAICMSRDGSQLILQKSDSSTELFDTDSGEKVLDLTKAVAKRGRILWLDDKLIVTADGRNVEVVNLETMSKTFTFLANSDVTDVTISHDGQYLLIGTDKKSAHLCNLKNSNSGQRLSQHIGRITQVQFLNDDKHFVTASNDGTVHIWPLPSKSAE